MGPIALAGATTTITSMRTTMTTGTSTITPQSERSSAGGVRWPWNRTYTTKPRPAATFEVLVEALKSVAQHVESAGGIVGHIKAYARAGDSFVHASATDAQHEPSCEGDASLSLGPEVHCQLVAIALLIDLEQLEQIVVGALN